MASEVVRDVRMQSIDTDVAIAHTSRPSSADVARGADAAGEPESGSQASLSGAN